MKWINEYLRSELGKIDSDALEQKDNFNLWHVEPLLNQAADLLDRCLSDHTTERSFEERSALISLDYEERKKRSQLEKKRVETDKVHERDDIIIREQKRILDAFLDEEATIADLEYLAKKLDDLNEAGGQNYRKLALHDAQVA